VSIGHFSPLPLAAATSLTVTRRVLCPPYSGSAWVDLAWVDLAWVDLA
jgi:hypothetical protein